MAEILSLGGRCSRRATQMFELGEVSVPLQVAAPFLATGRGILGLRSVKARHWKSYGARRMI